MKALLQRVTEGSVGINEKENRSINKGVVIFLGIHKNDTIEDVKILVKKTINIRIYSDKDGTMNNSLAEFEGEILLISQFTLYANTSKGNRPSFIDAASPKDALPLYNEFLDGLVSTGVKVTTGEFGAAMKVKLINDGPVTIMLES